MDEILDKYTFLPWIRRGLSSKIDEVDNLNSFSVAPPDGWNRGRSEMDIHVNIEAKKGDVKLQDQVTQKIKVVGPGDIISIDKRIVVKTEPKNWITNYEPNYFPYIEFYEVDFLWRYSPAAPINNKLRPWLSLIALKESEFERDETLFASLPSILVTGSDTDAPGTTGAASNVFPDAGQTWAWSHVHMNGDVHPVATADPNDAPVMNSAMNRFRNLLKANPDQAVSRMLCPRKLEPNTTYYCFLIPAFETGRLAGLGAKGDLIGLHEAQKASFGADHPTDGDHQKYVDHFPFYYEWQFMTGDVGDFESLVRKLVPREVDRRVGKRPMDVQQPGYGVAHGPGPIHNDGVLMLEGAMLPPRTTPEPDREPYPWSISASESTYRKRLADLINLSEDLRKATFPPDQFYGTNPFGYAGVDQSIEDDPIITPDMYGRWHALKDTLDSSLGAINFNNTWLYEANLDPRSRSVAGLGVKHIKNNQEKLMDKAWSQLGEVIEANRKLRWGQLSKQITLAAYKKHIVSQRTEQINAITAKLFKRIKVDDTTAYKQIKDSILPNATQSYAFRKIERPQSPLMKRLDPNNAIFTQNSMRVSLANASLRAVDEKVISADQASIPLHDIQVDVDKIASHTVTSPIFATMEPMALSFEPNIESEVRFHSAVTTYQNYFDDANWQGVSVAPTINLADLTQKVVAKIDPRFVIPRRVYDRIRIPGYTIPPADKIIPIMAYPKFNDLMYQAVRDLGTDYLIPNLDLIPNNSITLLESNQKFIEAFMLGVNHEMGRELLWREFPTDQRGSYFQQFWDSVDAVNVDGDSDVDLTKKNLDIREIHTWPSNTELGTHSARPGAVSGLLILVVRGDLLKKYPNTVIYAQKAKFVTGSDHSKDPRTLVSVEDDANAKRYAVFSAKIEPDIHFFGFNLSAEEARGDRNTNDPGWFFVIQERPGEIRFGVDVADELTAPPATWNDLNQSNAAYSGAYLDATDDAVIPSGVNGNSINQRAVKWGVNSTNMAQILYQNPMLLAVHGDEMIP
jgi:hypothetical protein